MSHSAVVAGRWALFVLEMNQSLLAQRRRAGDSPPYPSVLFNSAYSLGPSVSGMCCQGGIRNDFSKAFSVMITLGSFRPRR